MSKLSSPHSEMVGKYGVIVIGSGYGGSILAARLAEKGHDIALFERGAEWQTGEFPDSMEKVRDSIKTKES